MTIRIVETGLSGIGESPIRGVMDCGRNVIVNVKELHINRIREWPQTNIIIGADK
jgi:hypothetical protein